MATPTMLHAASHTHSIREVDVGRAALVGLLASLVMALFSLPIMLLAGLNPFQFIGLTATTLVSDNVAFTAGGVLLGLAVQLVLGVMFGVLFAVFHTWITKDYALASSLALGLLFGILIWALTFVLIGPATGARVALEIAPEISLILALISGFVLGFYPTLLPAHRIRT